MDDQWWHYAKKATFSCTGSWFYFNFCSAISHFLARHLAFFCSTTAHFSFGFCSAILHFFADLRFFFFYFCSTRAFFRPSCIFCLTFARQLVFVCSTILHFRLLDQSKGSFRHPGIKQKLNNLNFFRAFEYEKGFGEPDLKLR